MRKVILLLALAVLLTFSVFADDHVYVYDGADLFDDADETEITLAAEKVYTESGLLTVVVTDYGIYGMLSSLPEYSGGAEDMLLLAIDMDAREFDLYQHNATYGESAFRISYSESESILDSILPSMADGDYAEAAMLYIELASTYFSNSDNFSSTDVGDGYEYTDYYEDLGIGAYIVTGLLVGSIIGGITVLVVYLVYKRKVHGDTYPLGRFADFKLTENKDTFITKNVIVTRIPDPPSSSGGRSGGGGSRSGGGGARMGGRSF